MRSKMMKRTLAVALSATMVMGMSATAFAADATPASGTTGDVPIFSFDVEQVVVPTQFVTAFNPDELSVKVGTGTSTDQVLSQSYGILNKSSKDKLVTVDLKVTDQNAAGANKVTFVDTDAEVDSADKDTYAIHLTAVPADDSEVKVGDTPASADKDTLAAALGKVTMTKAAAGKEVTLKDGNNQMAFKLDKATYSPKSGSEVTLGTTQTNDVTSNYEITAVAAAGKGITAFTFAGKLNNKADWTKLSSGIKLEATYTFANAETTDTVISGTGAMVEVESFPTFSTGSEVGSISYTPGLGNKALKAIKTITMDFDGTPYDGYNAVAHWVAATDEEGVITFDSAYTTTYANAEPDATVKDAIVTYETQGGDEKTATVSVKLR